MAEVNLDVAMESTSQEILEKVNTYTLSPAEKVKLHSGHFTTEYNSTELVEVLNVSGSGELYYATVYGCLVISNTRYLRIKIVVDDETVLDAECSFTGSGSSSVVRKYIGFVDMSNVIGTNDTGLSVYGGSIPIGENTWLTPLSSELQSKTWENNGNVASVLSLNSLPLKFEKNFTISFSTTYAGSDASKKYGYICGYSLDEE